MGAVNERLRRMSGAKVAYGRRRRDALVRTLDSNSRHVVHTIGNAPGGIFRQVDERRRLWVVCTLAVLCDKQERWQIKRNLCVDPEKDTWG